MTRKTPKGKSLKSRQEKKTNKANKNKQPEKPYRMHHSGSTLVTQFVKVMEAFEKERQRKIRAKGIKEFVQVLCPVRERLHCLNSSLKTIYCDECYLTKRKDEIIASGGIFVGCGKPYTGKRACQKCAGG